MSQECDWLWNILTCPECGRALDPGSDQLTIVCGDETCGYQSRREGRLFNLLPRDLDRHQAAEHSFRMEVLARWAEVARGMNNVELCRFQLLNILTYYPFPAQYTFFREHFVRRYHLEGRGLELGGATGESSGFIKLFYPETEMVTTDVAPVNVTLAAQLAEFLRFDTDYFVMADAERLPFRPSSFDFIFSSGMLHHLGNIRRGLQQGYKVLKPGGRWYVANELSIGSPFRLFWNSRWGDKGRQAHVAGVREHSYTLQEWQTFFQKQDLKIVDLHFRRDPSSAARWPYAAYYTILGRLPVTLLKMGIPCNVNFVLEKTLA